MASFNHTSKDFNVKTAEKTNPTKPFQANPFVSRLSANPFLLTPAIQCSFGEQIKRDAPYEQLAHKFVYQNPKDMTKEGALEEQNKTNDELSKLGYTSTGLKQGSGSFEMQLFIPISEDSGMPVLAFRGSQEAMDFVHDANPAGVGIAQFDENIKLIAEVLQGVAKVDVTGHSLGGALAQYTAVAFPNKVRRVVTFQSPGIPASRLQKLLDHNAESKNPIESTHYRNRGDIVDDAGEAFTPGEALTFDHSLNPATAHTDFILANYQSKKAENPKHAPKVTISEPEGIGSDRPWEKRRQNLMTQEEWEAARQDPYFKQNPQATPKEYAIYKIKQKAKNTATRLVNKLGELRGK
jgi:hypothetical protein